MLARKASQVIAGPTPPQTPPLPSFNDEHRQTSNALPAVPALKAPPRPRRILCDWMLTKNLGQGSMGKVKLAIHTITKQKVSFATVPYLEGQGTLITK